MSTSALGSPGLRVVRGAVEPLAAELIAWLREPAADPFTLEHVCVDTPGMQRWLAQQIGRQLGAEHAGDGVCAGIEFASLARVADQVTAAVSGVSWQHDPWAASRLPWAVLTAIAECRAEPWFAVVARHLGAPGDPVRPGRHFAVATRIARLFRRYMRHRPALVREWTAGRVGQIPAEHEWQARLWRVISDQVAVPDPVTRHDEAMGALRAGHAAAPDRLAVFAPGEVSALEQEFLAAFGSTRPALALTVGPPEPGSPALLLDRLAHADRALAAVLPATTTLPPAASPPSLLAAVQARASGQSVPAVAPDDSIQIHLSHGPARQVEVLREALTAALAADPTLQPRDIVVLCPDIATYAPLLSAALCLPPEAEPAHPGHRLRVRVIPESSPAGNPVLALLVRLCEFVGSRAAAPDLLQLAAEPPVAARFGLTTDSLVEADALLWQAGVQWGIDATDRERFGLGGLAQGTLSAGLDRLLVGVALDSADLATIGGVLPVPNIESSAVATVGALAELIARIEHFADACRHPRSAEEWVDLLLDTVTQFAAVPAADAWQLSAVAGALGDLRTAAGVTPALTLADIKAALAAHLRDTPGRNSFGTGALAVCALGAQRHVPHRMVVLLGIDEANFPRSARDDGDDLLTVQAAPGDPDPRRDDRQLFLDALLSARERFVVIGQHRNPSTNEPVPLALPVLDLLDAVAQATDANAPQPAPSGHADPTAAVVHEHALYPFSRSAAGIPTFDAAAARARLQVSGTAAVPTFDPDLVLPPVPPRPLHLSDLRAFIRSPLRVHLSARGGLNKYDAEAWTAELPLDMNGLDQWHVGDRVLRAVLAGADLETALAAERARGVLPPYKLALAPEATVRSKVSEALARAQHLPAAEVVHHDLRVDLGDRVVSGTVAVRGDAICAVTYSKLNQTNSLDTFLSLLLVQAALPETRWRALLATPREYVSWQLTRTDARTQLRVLTDLYDLGLTRVLPLPFKTGYKWALDQHEGSPDPFQGARNEWYRDEGDERTDWGDFFPRFADLIAAPPPADLPPVIRPARTLFETAARAIWGPIFEERRQ